MPLSLTFTEGALPKGSEKEAGKRITEAFLKWHGLSGNKVMTPNVTNHINVLPKDSTLSGGEPFVGAWIETKTPSFALATREIQEGFFKEATDIIEELSGGKLPRENIYANAVHTVDGTWTSARGTVTSERKTTTGLVLGMVHVFTTSDGGVVRTRDVAERTAVPGKKDTYMLELAYTVVASFGYLKGYTGTFNSFGLLNMGTGEALVRYSGEISK